MEGQDTGLKNFGADKFSDGRRKWRVVGWHEFGDDGAKHAKHYTGAAAISHTDGVGTKEEEWF